MNDDPPDGNWSVSPEERRSASELRRLRLEYDDEATFLVWIHERDDPSEPFQLRLATISQTDDRVRHDYPVESFETGVAAFEALDEFTDVVETCVREGSLSSDDPSVETVQVIIDEFTDVGLRTRLDRFLARLG